MRADLLCRLPQLENRLAYVEALGQEARAAGVDEAAVARLDAHVKWARERMAEYVALDDAHRDAERAAAEAEKAVESAIRNLDPVADLRVAAERARVAVGRARDACWQLAAEVDRAREAFLAPLKRADENIEAIAITALRGFGGHHANARRALDDHEAAVWEPLFEARAIAKYPEWKREREFSGGLTLKEFKATLAERRALRTERFPTKGVA